MLNQCIVMGRMTADPELRHTQGGLAVTTFRLAVDRYFKDKNTGEKGVDFLPVVCWRGTAEFVSRYFSKGRLTAVTGRLQVREYTTKDGEKRYATEIVADNVYFGDSKKEERKPLEPSDPYYMGPGSYEIDEDEGLPFD